MSPEYAAALEIANKATADYRASCEAYRAMEIDDAEFAIALAAKKKAEAAFDAAFAAEESRG